MVRAAIPYKLKYSLIIFSQAYIIGAPIYAVQLPKELRTKGQGQKIA